MKKLAPSDYNEEYNYESSSKFELWTWMKQQSNLSIIMSFLAGCALSPFSHLFTPSRPFVSLLFAWATTLISGAVLGLLLYVLPELLLFHSEPRLSRLSKILIAVSVPLAAILLKYFLKI